MACLLIVSFMEKNDTIHVHNPTNTMGVKCTQKAPILPLSIDWLSVSCKRYFTQNRFVVYEPQNYSTKIFKKVEKIQFNNTVIGTLVSEPRSKLLPINSCIFKFENWFLYQTHFLSNIQYYLNEIGLQYKGINRVDICLDFKTFKNNLKPENFIKGFVDEKYKYVGKTKFKVMGNTSDNLKFNYFRVGTNYSNTSFYMYNKSQELNEVADKPHIRALWKQCNLEDNKDIWRLECSIKSTQVQILDLQYGEIIPIDLQTIGDFNQLKRLYFSSMKGRFRFRIRSKDSNYRRWPYLILFDAADNIEYRTVSTPYRKDVTKSHKIALNKYIDYYENIKYLSDEITDSLETAIVNYANYHKLTNYLENKTSFAPRQKIQPQHEYIDYNAV